MSNAIVTGLNPKQSTGIQLRVLTIMLKRVDHINYNNRSDDESSPSICHDDDDIAWLLAGLKVGNSQKDQLIRLALPAPPRLPGSKEKSRPYSGAKSFGKPKTMMKKTASMPIVKILRRHAPAAA